MLRVELGMGTRFGTRSFPISSLLNSKFKFTIQHSSFPLVLRRTPFVVPLMLFLAAAGTGLLFAWDVAAAQAKLIFIAGGILVYFIVVALPMTIRGRDTTRVLFAVLPAVLCVAFLLTQDWSYRLGKIPMLDPLMRVLQAVRLPIAGETLNTNSAGGLIAALIPFQAHALFHGWKSDHIASGRSGRLVAILLLALSLFTLVLSASRGAWLALALVTAVWLATRMLRPRWLGVVVVAVAVVLAAIFAGDWLLRAVAEDRLPIWAGSLQLAADTPFTGIGPNNFAMPYASYVILSHVPYLTHAHNLYLDVWLDGGVLGVWALLIVGVTAVYQARRSFEWRAAAFAAIAVVALHGLLDDALYAYAPAAQLLMWLPLAAIARVSERPTWRMVRIQLGATLVTLGVGYFVVALWPALHSRWETNLGAIAQNKLELPGYTYEKWGQQDKLRREGHLDYTVVRSHFQSALTLDGNNANANRRLAQLALAVGDYPTAKMQLERAFAVAPADRATRQMLGEVRAIDGQPAEASALWQTVDLRQNQLELRLSWYRDFLGDAERAQRMQTALAEMAR